MFDCGNRPQAGIFVVVDSHTSHFGTRHPPPPPEALLWLAGLLYLALAVDPYADTHLNLCVAGWLGIEHCPGCGLGRSIALLFRGEIASSLQAHPLGWFAVVVLTTRIVTLLRKRPAQSAAPVDHNPVPGGTRCRTLWNSFRISTIGKWRTYRA
ncbi:MAG TPA: DUF2752 domain-containing protein [Acidobacteriota bacterium]|nr:DUF2752 domain-containing protein [Acidobacteriota bacterium]